MIVVNLVGKRFGRLLVKAPAGVRLYSGMRQRVWHCLCDCGATRIARTSDLNFGRAVSCGSHKGENLKKLLTTHGETRGRNPSKEYIAWKSMKDRCNNPLHKGFKYYGGRGIAICARWKKFENFLADMGRAPSKDHSIDRRDVNGNYTPKNSHWATRSEQQLNKRNSSFSIAADGSKKSLIQISDETGIKYQTLQKRLKKAKSLGISATHAFITRPLE